MQAGSMTGLFEIKLDGAGGDGRDRMPWQYSEAMQNQFRQILDDRMQFVPYLYSLAQTSADNGSLMQPMAYRHLDDSNTYAIWDQFYVGDGILVAPVFDASDKRSVYLPKGQWRDFDAPAKRFEGGKTINIDAPLTKFPRFVKANSLFVTGNLHKGSSKLWDQQVQQLTIHAFPGKKGSQNQFDYVDMLDGDKHKKLSIEHTGKQVLISSPAVNYARQFEVILDTKPTSITLNNKVVQGNYDAKQKVLTVRTDKRSDIQLKVFL
jgi:alpha-glucosidase (family GH31 glycosyl hydrolase)